jgi:hypothetical protein
MDAAGQKPTTILKTEAKAPAFSTNLVSHEPGQRGGQIRRPGQKPG